MHNPAVSVLIPSRRRGAMRDEALRSLDAQSSTDYEVLMAHSPRYDGGMAGACEAADKMNRLAAIAAGKGLVVLADDDRLQPFAIEMMQATAATHHADIVYSSKIREYRYYQDIYRAGEWTREAFRQRNPVEGLTALVSAALWETVGGMDGSQLFMDWAFWYACFLAGATAVRTDQALWINRMHGDQLQGTDPSYTEGRRLLVQKYPELAL